MLYLGQITQKGAFMNIKKELKKYINFVLEDRKRLNRAYSQLETNKKREISLCQHYLEKEDLLDSIIHELGMLVNLGDD